MNINSYLETLQRMVNHRKRGNNLFDDYALKYVELYGCKFIVKQLQPDELQELLKSGIYDANLERQIIEKGRNEECSLFLMLNCDEFGAGWYLGYQYANAIDICPFSNKRIKFDEVFKL